MLNATNAVPHKHVLPKELEIVVNDMSGYEPPTHLMAVYAAKNPQSQAIDVKLYPAHGLIFAINCARLPVLPRNADRSSFPQSSERSSSGPQLFAQIQPLCLPHPQTFLYLSTYLYTKDPSFLYAPPFLLRAGQEGFDPAKHPITHYAAELARMYTGPALLKSAYMVYGFWQNVCALGIFDDEIWDAMDVVWQVSLTALAISTGSTKALDLSSTKTPSSS